MKKNDKTTIYFLRSFFFDKDIVSYLKLIEDMCENDIQVFKTDKFLNMLLIIKNG